MSTDQLSQSDLHRDRLTDEYMSDRDRSYSGDIARLNGHELVPIDEWLPGTEPHHTNLISPIATSIAHIAGASESVAKNVIVATSSLPPQTSTTATSKRTFTNSPTFWVKLTYPVGTKY